MRRMRRSLFSRAMRTKSSDSPGSSPTTPSAISPSEALIEVSGVRSSWLTVEMNSFFMRFAFEAACSSDCITRL